MEGDSGRNIITNNIFVNIAQQADMQAIVLAGASAFGLLPQERRTSSGACLCLSAAAACFTPLSGACLDLRRRTAALGHWKLLQVVNGTSTRILCFASDAEASHT